jgi:thiamine pyrophosphate-dependent acetolactate synthase large subunit-like protein
MAKTVAHQFVETLTAADVKRIYGIIGDRVAKIADGSI